MEDADTMTANAEWPVGEQQLDESDGEQNLEGRSISRSRKAASQKLKTSERRRIQNRQAQKTYRDKQKRRLQVLESFAKSQTAIAQDAADISTPTSTVSQDMAGMLAVDSPIMGLSELLQHHDLPTPDTAISRLGGCDSSLSTASLNHPISGAVPIYGYVSNSNFHVDGDLNTNKSFREDLFATSTTLATLPGSEAVTPGSSLNSPCVQQGRTQPHSDSVTNGQPQNESESDSLLAQFLLQDDVTLSRKLLRDIRKNKITLKDVLRLGLQSLEKDSRSTSGSLKVTESSLQQRAYLQLPDLHANTIRITQMSFVAAVLYNATMLGITAPEMFSHDTESRFCTARRASSVIEDIPQQVTLVGIKEDLKPTQNQLTHRHHPYIDTLPFRVFRERLIALIHAEPSIINMAELCHDLQSDGVICWGSSAGHSGAPWDIRSWEVRPWFLKKWWMLTEGADGEMYQQARWWCEMRGEDVPALW